jgi:UDP-glucose 4-epimerase
VSKKILITGGAGYIGSHALVEFVNAGMEVVAIDNFSNSSPHILKPLQRLCQAPFHMVHGDVRNEQTLERVFDAHDIGTVVHFAGSKAVAESLRDPLLYFDNNLSSTLALLRVMRRKGVRRLVFSSSATVYGEPEQVPVAEHALLRPANPYGRTKLMCEQILQDLQQAEPDWAVAILRYFNPVGAHESALIGEAPHGLPHNLMPCITRVASGKQASLSIFGADYPTPDGTGIRDFVHVVDLAQGHLAAARCLQEQGRSLTVNLGTGVGVSVMALVNTFERVTGVAIPFHVMPRRPGDMAFCFADTSLAHQTLGWRAERDVQAMCADAWRWQTSQPLGDGLLEQSAQ